MSKPFHLQILLDLAKESSDSAAVRLGGANGQLQDMQERLNMLLDYRTEYTQRLASGAQSGLSCLDLRNFREFIGKIDLAISMQNAKVASASAEVQASQLDWLTQQRKLRSFDALSRRHRSTEHRCEARREQREQDDQVSSRFFARRVMG